MKGYVVEVARKRTTGGDRLKSRDEALVKSVLDKEDDLENFNFQDCLLRNPNLSQSIVSIRVYPENEEVLVEGANLVKEEINVNRKHNGISKYIKAVHIYELNSDGEEAEYMDVDDEGAAAASHHWILPQRCFEGLWDSLVFENGVQSRLIKYIDSALLFADKGVDTNLISWNKVILLHGPPGTGKTSLCKALAQKSLIRLSHRYLYGQLVEINSHSLFSRWFSESGKLVMKMFDNIHELLEDKKCLVFLLIDEVESLAQCRQSAGSGNEPADSIRAVNALLTQIDKIKRYPNVVILTTSNIVGSIDLAFVDRADLKIYIGPPPPEVTYTILASSINELIRVGIVSTTETNYIFPEKFKVADAQNVPAMHLFNIAARAQGMSGRTLRKIPFLAHTNFMTSTNCDLDQFVEGVGKTVDVELKEAQALKR